MTFENVSLSTSPSIQIEQKMSKNLYYLPGVMDDDLVKRKDCQQAMTTHTLPKAKLSENMTSLGDVHPSRRVNGFT